MSATVPISASGFWRLRPSPTIFAAGALTLVLMTAWTLKDWSALRLLRLPDNDDMMRLAEVRDWLGGQGFNDLTQYRLGPPFGSAMHWSRIADAGPALLILLYRPLLGDTGAELAMVISYQAILFFCYLLLVSRIARRFGGPRAALPGLLLAALAFPTTSLLVPGRIDHHGLQILLMLVTLDTLAALPSFRRGLIGGVATALSLAIGLEAAPEIVAAMAGIGVLWLIGTDEEDRRALGFGVGLGGITLLLFVFARPHAWPEQWCDGFTPSSVRAALVLGGAWVLLGVSGRVASGMPRRMVAAALIGGGATLLAYRAAPVCFAGPYDALDPFLKQVWMSNVSEAKDLFFGQDTIGTSLAYGGLMFVGLLLASLRAARARLAEPRWLAFTLFLAISTVAAVLQVRVTYILAGIATIPVAVAVAERSGAAQWRARLLLWVAGAGITYNAIGGVLDPLLAHPITEARVAARACTKGESILGPAHLPRGTIMAPLDLGSYLIGMTPHHVVAAGYHRNNTGNSAMYRFFLAPPADARQMARDWHIDYVATCPQNLREAAVAPYRPGSLIDVLQNGGSVPWLERIPAGESMLFYRVRRP